MPDSNWTELLGRLEVDLQARTGDAAHIKSDEEAWQLLAQVVWDHARVLRSSYSDLNSQDIQDLVHDVLLKLQSTSALRRLRAARSTEGYLFVVLRNAANDLLRRQKAEKLVEKDTLESLDESDLQLFQMHFWHDMSISDIAAQTNSSYSTVAAKLFRMLAQLRLQMTDVERRIYYEELYRQLPMKTILSDLSEEERSLLRWRVIDELSVREIAELSNQDIRKVQMEWNKLSMKLRMRARSVLKKPLEML